MIVRYPLQLRLIGYLSHLNRHVAEPGMNALNWPAMGVGFVCAAVSGCLCIRYFLRYLQTKSFMPFIVYGLLLAGSVLVFHLQLR